MAGRPRSFDRETAIDAFVDIFWSCGFDGASIDDLQAAIGVKRGSFYAAFDDKPSVFAAVVDRYVEVVTARAFAALDTPQNPRQGLAALLRYIGDFMGENLGRGCMVMTALTEPPPSDAKITQAIRSASAGLFSRIEDAAEKAAEKGLLVPGETAASLSAFVTAMVMGLNAMARARSAPTQLSDAAERAAQLVEGASGSSVSASGPSPS